MTQIWSTAVLSQCIGEFKKHYDDVIMDAMTSQITTSRLFIQPFIQTQIKENIKAPRHWPLC